MCKSLIKPHIAFLLFVFITDNSLAQFFESSNLPIIKINTHGGIILNTPKIIAEMQIIDNGPGKRNDRTDTANNYSGNIGIEYRGSSSQMFPKKSFGIEIRTKLGIDTTASLLGLPEENDWILYAPYTDKSFLRDVLTYKLSNDMGRYASRTVFCELILNDSLQGVYVLMEKIKRDKNRVDISKLNPDENTGDDLTGGYIVKIDKFDGENSGNGWVSPYRSPNYSSTDQAIYFQYDYPKNTDISSAQQNYIKDYVTAFENALAGAKYNDLFTGYRAFADINSMVDYAIINEISHNVDGYRLSTFIHKDKDSKGGKLVFGPIWDINLGYGNADYCDGGSYTGWAYRFNDVCNTDYWQVPFWWYKLFSDIQFRTLISERWTQLRQGPFKNETILHYIDSTAAALDEAQQRNYLIWPILGTYIWPNNFIGNSYQEEIDYLKSWITSRLSWLDVNFQEIPTALNDKVINDSFSVYPNPFTDEVHFCIPHNLKNRVEIRVYDALGNELWNAVGDNDEKNGLMTWNSRGNKNPSVQKGIYFITLSSNGQIIQNQKIIKIN
jgi:hypothetical protein